MKAPKPIILRIRLAALGALALTTAALPAQDAPPAPAPEMPSPTAEHRWLERFAGEWDVESEIYTAPGTEPMLAKGHESARMFGGFWVIGEGTGDAMGFEMKWILTFGYDTEKKVYVGTWIDSMSTQKWDYQGTVDEGGNILTLTTRGLCPIEKRLCDYRSTVEFKSDIERVFTEEKQGLDGSWNKVVVSRFNKKP
jgi:hypothetical protein